MSGFASKLKGLFRKKKEVKKEVENKPIEGNKLINNIMARKTVITKVLDVNTSDAIIEFPQNRTLMVEQLTDKAPTRVDMQRDFSSMQDVYDHYKPNVDVEFEDGQGRPVKENISFKESKDFEAEGILKNSQFLHSLKLDKESYEKIEQQLKKNKPLRDALSNAESKKDLVNALKALLAELEK